MNQESKIKSLLDALLRYFEDFNGEVPYFEPIKDGRISTPCRLRRAVAVRR